PPQPVKPPKDEHPPQPVKPPKDEHPPQPVKPPKDEHPPQPVKPQPKLQDQPVKPPQVLQDQPVEPPPGWPKLLPQVLQDQPVEPPPGWPKLLPQSPKQPPYEAKCSKSFLIAARGSGENPVDVPNNLNIKGEESALSVMYDQLNSPKGTTGVYGSSYPAEGALVFATESNLFSQSLSPTAKAAAKELVNVLRAHVEKCQKQKIYLAGYSQGAAVIREVLNSAPELHGAISGIVLFGDAVIFGKKLPSGLENKTLDICVPGDPICGVALESWGNCVMNSPSCPHFSYATKSEDGPSQASVAAALITCEPCRLPIAPEPTAPRRGPRG
ncbi:cutinase family protein, partial [Streptomyces virginiae]|uniref:cutinase family protein n=1 Tax=Streptomyces virginiae TaxID=1961 RepID=UPI0033BDBB0F